MDINKVNTKILPVSFDYYAPSSIEELLSILRREEEVVFLAGGTDLLVKMKQRIVEPKVVVSLNRISELSFIEEREDGLHVGAVTKLRAIERSDVVREKFPVLYYGVRAIGSVQIRNMGTIGGNLCNASPAADSAPPLMVLNAELKTIGVEGERSIPINEFFVGPGKTVLRSKELLAEIKIPHLPPNSGTSFIKIARTSMDIAKINVAVMVRLENGRIGECRIALGAVAPTPMRAKEAEEFLTGKEVTDENLRRAGEIVSKEIRPITDIRSTAEYRREVSKVLTYDALRIAIREASKE